MSSQAHLNKVVRQLNERPRKALGIETQQKDLMQVLRRPVETTTQSPTFLFFGSNDALGPGTDMARSNRAQARNIPGDGADR